MKWMKSKYRKLTLFANQFPGPFTWPIFGNSLDFLRGTTVLMKKISEYTRKYSGIPYRLWIGSELFIVISDAEEIETVLYGNTTASKPKLFDKFYAFFGKSVWIEPDGSKAKYYRKKLIPAFHNNILTQYIPITREKSEQLIQSIAKYANKTGDDRIFNLWKYVPFTAFDIVTKAMVNLELDHKDQHVLRFHEIEESGTDLCFLRMMCPFVHNDFVDNLVFGRRIKSMQNELAHFLRTTLKTKLETIKQGARLQSVSNMDGDDDIRYEDEDALSLYMKIIYDIAKEGGDEDLIYTEMVTIMEAGTSPIALLVCFSLLALSIHQEIQDKVYEEIYEIFGTSEREITDTDVQKLTYTGQVLNETLRRFGGPFMFREVKTQTKIGKYKYPAGCNIAISQFGLHLNPKYYKNPMQFNPDNFSPEAIKSRHKCSFIGYSAGPRNCIGYPFAILETKIIICCLLRKYIFKSPLKSVEDIELQCGFMISSKIGYPVTIEPRIKIHS